MTDNSPRLIDYRIARVTASSPDGLVFCDFVAEDLKESWESCLKHTMQILHPIADTDEEVTVIVRVRLYPDRNLVVATRSRTYKVWYLNNTLVALEPLPCPVPSSPSNEGSEI